MTENANNVPPWQDLPTLCRNICVSSTTVDNWVARRILPPPRKRGGKLMWKWSEVDKALTEGTANDEKSELDTKRGRLVTFIGGDTYREIDPVEQSRLNRQLEAMTLYSNILNRF